MRHLAQFVLLYLVLCVPSYAQQGDQTSPCANPRVAADTLFIWQRPESYDLKKASQCLDADEASRERVAVQLLQVLDARGIFVPVSSMSVDPDYTEDGHAHHVPLPDSFPELVLVRGEDAQWRYSRDTVDAVPRLYRETFSPVSLWFQNHLPSPFYKRFLTLFLWQYLYGALLLAAAWLVGQGVRVLLRDQVRRAVRKLGMQLDATAYARTNGPLVLMCMIGIVSWGLTELQLPISVSHLLHRGLRLALWLTLLVGISRFINLGAHVANAWASKTESKLDDQLIPLVRQAAQTALIIIGGLYLADAIGLDVWKLAAGVGIGGLAFALAAQDTVANLFGSVNIFVDRPFQIGDWVQVGSVEGVVEEVGFRSTRVRTFYNSVVTIPNSQITNANVDNFGLRNRRRCKLVLGLTYDTSPDLLQAYVEGVRAILAAHPDVEKTYEVHVYNLGDSAIEILVYYHLIVPGWHEELSARSQNILEFMRLAQHLGVSFAFPSTSLYLESTPEHPIATRPETTLSALESQVASFGPDGDQARPRGPEFQRSWSVQARQARQDPSSNT